MARCMAIHVKPVLRGNPHHTVFNIGINDIPSNKTPETIEKSILGVKTSSS